MRRVQGRFAKKKKNGEREGIRQKKKLRLSSESVRKH